METEFKNEVFRDVLQKLGTEKLIHSPPYRPQSNGRIEGFHRYLKACIAKHMRNGLEWDQITAMATAAYNYFSNMSAKESAFFLMYGRDPVNKLSSILNAPRRYLGDETGLPDLEARRTCTRWWHNSCTTPDNAISKTTSTTRYLTTVFLLEI